VKGLEEWFDAEGLEGLLDKVGPLFELDLYIYFLLGISLATNPYGVSLRVPEGCFCFTGPSHWILHWLLSNHGDTQGKHKLTYHLLQEPRGPTAFAVFFTQ
jgi:hypothetical protein